jgi:hypothetical protein
MGFAFAAVGNPDRGRPNKRVLATECLPQIEPRVASQLGFPPGSGGTRSEHYAASPVIPSMTIRASVCAFRSIVITDSGGR